MKIKQLNKNINEIVDTVMGGKDVRCLDLTDESIDKVLFMTVDVLRICLAFDRYIFVEVIDEN